MIRNHMLFHVFYFSVCFVAVTVARESIINGYRAASYQFRYHVAIFIGSEAPSCGGGIIGDRYILTAANCVIGSHGHLAGKPVSILTGSSDLHKRVIVADVEQIIVPKEYKPQSLNTTGDIAVLKLKKSLDLEKNQYLSLLKLPSDPRQFHEGAVAIVTGFGWNWIRASKYNRTGGYDDTHLRYGESIVLSPYKCEKEHPMLNITNKSLCARLKQDSVSEPRGVCVGDGGAPLVYRGKIVIGIFSIARNDCSELESSAVYTRVSHYLYFLRNAMKNRKTAFMRYLDV